VKAEIRRLGRDSGGGVVVLDVPLLMESGLLDECDAFVYVHANAATRRERVCRARGWKAPDWRTRERLQSGLKSKRAIADYIVDNGGVQGFTFKQVKEVFQKIQQQAAAGRSPQA
jgi:dephospho-CoA kinase